jgi:hypothetical protein
MVLAAWRDAAVGDQRDIDAKNQGPRLVAARLEPYLAATVPNPRNRGLAIP